MKAMINAIQTALSGLTAASKQANASASNIANQQTAGSLEEGGQAPYTPRDVARTADANGGAAATTVSRNPPFVPAYDADSPFADENGIIGLPNVDLATEIVNLNLSEIAYKANLKALQAASDLSNELFRIIDKDA